MKRTHKLFAGLALFALLLTGCNSGGSSEGGSSGGGGSDNPPAHEHTWGTSTYVWAVDYSSCTAERVCTEDATHKETETKASVYSVTPSGCESEGQELYTVTFENSAFETQTQTITLNPTNHNWDAPTYEWSSDYSQCTATRVCQNNNTHVETETANSTYKEIRAATVDLEGLGRYTVTFVNAAFTTQTYDVDIDKLEPSKTPIVSEDGKIITYGLYPQKNINKSSLISALNGLTTPELNGWYLYEGDYYAKFSATPSQSSYKFDNGTTISSGTTYWFKCEPIVWNVLSNTNGEYYIVSSLLLDAHCYYNSTSIRTIDNQTIYPNNYKYSDIRSWLNEDFYNSAFALGNSHIQTVIVDNSSDTTDNQDNIYVCDNTEDKVFLPSYQDYINSSYGFSTSIGITDTRCCKTTDWARARGCHLPYQTGAYANNGRYSTRSPDYEQRNCIKDIDVDGEFDRGFVSSTFDSVRPAIKIKML